jgi:tripartite-type tricarboxylate transporter receptor subunit TctC
MTKNTGHIGRKIGAVGLALGIAGGTTLGAHAATDDAWPNKPVTVIVSVAAGGPTDAVARRVMQEVALRIGQPVVIDNRPGGNGMVATKAVATAPPDGYTYGVVLAAHALNPSLYTKLAYDESAVTGVSMLGKYPMLLIASGTLPVTTLADLKRHAKERPGTLSYASSGQGSLTHLSMERLATRIETPLAHIPYRGNSQAMSDLFEGRLALTFDTLLLSEQNVKAGKLKALAITGDRRSPVLPDVPTIAEAGYPDLETYGWIAVVGSSKAPALITERFSREIAEAAQQIDVRKLLDANSLQATGGTPAQTDRFIAAETAAWKKVIEKANFKLD